MAWGGVATSGAGSIKIPVIEMRRRDVKRRAFGYLLASISAAFVFATDTSVAQSPSPGERSQFIAEINTAFFSTTNGEPLSLGKGEGWRGFVLAGPGTPLTAFSTPYDALGHGSVNISKLLDSVSSYDKVLLVESGIAQQGVQSIAEVWELILNNSRPSSVASAARPVSEDVQRILFREPDDIDRARGIEYRSEPSPEVLRYRDYNALYRMLVVSESRGDAAWRLHPKLAGYGSLEDAKVGILNDWIEYGNKVEVEAALAKYEVEHNSSEWRIWSRANAMFSNNRLPLDDYATVPITLLSPEPSDWFGIANWFNCVSATVISGQAIRVRFQLARVRIERPWLDIELLINGGLHVQGALARAISEGKAPDVTSYPKGIRAVYPEEIVLVRNIIFTQGNGSSEVRIDNPNNSQPFGLVSTHPLGLYSYRDQINLLGFIVRALPSIPLGGKP
jgi:hypothetical protein